MSGNKIVVERKGGMDQEGGDCDGINLHVSWKSKIACIQPFERDVKVEIMDSFTHL